MKGIVGKRHDSMTLMKALSSANDTNANLAFQQQNAASVKKVAQIAPKEFQLNSASQAIASPKAGDKGAPNNYILGDTVMGSTHQ